MATTTMTMKTIPVARIDRDPAQPRENFDPVKLEELAASVKELGVQQPIRVRYDRATRRYTLMMGERRWRAARMAGLEEVPAVVEHGTEASLLAQVAENTGRDDMTPMEEAKAFQRLVDEEGLTIGQIAKACGVSASYVEWRIDLLGLIGPAREALDKGHLPVGLAWYVCRLSAEAQRSVLNKWVRGEFASYRDAEAFAQARRDIEAHDNTSDNTEDAPSNQE